ncbi:LacI family DNA-binding transcriptional regulator [Cellulomonas triticagri]|uniref:LacI family transcriptional regulator n=1 Tax=Cellulomonas triticagri TaxID=2483352 RepID=A0A3M2IYJ1_9CELL|nr:LacI family DNA-binding transcriptional regulator [Cellulomonas triticagri]RMI06987.1 LacI family transcriptional regulator [Cellulomonas triticagri]
MTGRPTSRDVARRAGVSQATVSYALGGSAKISAGTRERVLAAAEELGYRPNLAARSMRTRRTGRLALLLPTPGDARGGLLSAAGAVAAEQGYTLEIRTVPLEAAARAATVAEVLDSGVFEGVLSFLALPDGAVGLPGGPVVVTLSEAFDDRLRVTGDLLGAEPLRRIMTALAARGHDRFLHLAGDLEYPSARDRRDVYRATVADLGVTDLGVRDCGWDGARAVAAVAALPDGLPPVTVVAANDVLATAAVRACLARGWRVPDDVGVTGWDDAVTSEFQTPSLTTVRVDFAALGDWAMRTLVAGVRGEEPPPELAGVQEVVWRESTPPVSG